jgi:hypothetical protein
VTSGSGRAISLEGRTQVITVHPALPTPAPGDADPLATWREIITAWLSD